MRLLLSIPLFFYVLIIANLVMLGGSVESSLLNVILFEFSVPSTRSLPITVSDAFILVSVLCLYVETFKATRTSVISIIDHALSMLVFVVFLIEFLVVLRLGNPTFLILTVISLTDVVLGFTVTISTAKRDFTVGS